VSQRLACGGRDLLGEQARLPLASLHPAAEVRRVLRLSDGQVRLHTGTLYAMLDRLREAGLIVVDREEVVESRLRRGWPGSRSS
jgi:primosomal protein N'